MDIIKEWIRTMYENEIKNVQLEIRNEHLWELGYDGNEPNPHTENIKRMNAYINILEEKIKSEEEK